MSNGAEKCLIIDDSYEFGQLLTQLLQDRFDTSYAPDVFTAQSLIKKHRFSVILCDVHMPIMGGFDFSMELRMQHIDTPIIYITGDITPEISKKALSCGGANLLAKPIDFDQLLEKINLAIEHSGDQSRNSLSEQDLAYIYNQIKTYYFDIDQMLALIESHNIPFDVVYQELEKKRDFGKCLLDQLEGIKSIAHVA